MKLDLKKALYKSVKFEDKKIKKVYATPKINFIDKTIFLIPSSK